MKKIIILFIASIVVFGGSLSAVDTTTTSDTVTIQADSVVEPGDSVILIGLKGASVTLGYTTYGWSALNTTTAGARAHTQDSSMVDYTDNALGPYLHYTLFNNDNTYKINVAISETRSDSSTTAYTDNLLLVNIYDENCQSEDGGGDVDENGSSSDGLGTAVVFSDSTADIGLSDADFGTRTGATGFGKVLALESDNAQDLITGIEGDDTYTGSNLANGPRLHYYLTRDPEDIDAVDIIYTILADSTS